MRNCKIISLLLLGSIVLLSSGCDLFRKMAGRPVSSEIEAKRALIEGSDSLHRLRLDSLILVQKQISDSLSSLDSLTLVRSSLLASRSLKPESRADLTCRYYVIVGTFSKSENALKRSEECRSNDYESQLIQYSNGFTAVGICPSNSLSKAYSSLQAVRSSSFSPDAWILENR